MSAARVARCSIEPMPKRSGRFTNGRAPSSVCGAISYSASRNVPKPRRKSKPSSIGSECKEETMTLTSPTIENLTLTLNQEIHVRAPLEGTFAALLEQMGPQNETYDGKPLPMKIEPWPGGRWYRDLGDGNGHFWAMVQAIKRPTLLALTA